MSVPAPMEAKLYRPRARPDVVRRARLAAPPVGSRTRLTLVAAPAGFGKTTLLAGWYGEGSDADDRRIAWVSLDENDRRAGSFWVHLLTAVDRAAPGSAAAGLTLLQSGQAPVETVLTGVLNELSVLAEDLEIVLDDYHLADGPEVRPGMAFLVDHLPPQVRLTLGTRADPVLPLARMRARGELTEVRATDLRFTPEEAATYLAAAGLDLSGADVATLSGRTEGWIAALHLAAVSLAGRDDPSAFIAGFAGDDRYVVDYLVEEVLDRQPADVRAFLLDTAVLERLTGALCDEVTGRTGSRERLERLERENLFVVPLDDQRRWYRYHHLFADVLRAHLLAQQPDRVPDLHRRASRWYDVNGDAPAAVRHALAAGDVERASDLVELAVPALRRERREAVIRGWVDELPADEVGRRPVLALGLVGGLMAGNEFEGVPQRLDEVERLLALPQDQVVVVDRAELARLPAAVEMYRAALALVGGDAALTTGHATRARDLAAARGDTLVGASASALLGLAAWSTGELLGALVDYRAAVAGLRAVGHVADVLGCSIAVADLELALGRLHDGRATLEEALDLAATVAPGLRGTADMHDGLADLDLERGDLASAAAHLRRSDELGEAAGLPQHPWRWRATMASLREAEGDLAGAAELLEEAQRVFVADFSPEVRPLASRLARVQIGLGDLAAARAWARRRELTAADDASYLREHEHLTLARLLLAEGDLAGAESLLGRVSGAAAEGGRLRAHVEALVLLSAVRREQGERAGAAAVLERARLVAAPEGFVRVLAEGTGPGAATPGPVAQVLVDPLSDRELEVLRLLVSDLDGPAIARELVVSLHTVRTHTKHIYAKLGVNSRRAAVTRAHQLGLLRRPH